MSKKTDAVKKAEAALKADIFRISEQNCRDFAAKYAPEGEITGLSSPTEIPAMAEQAKTLFSALFPRKSRVRVCEGSWGKDVFDAWLFKPAKSKVVHGLYFAVNRITAQKGSGTKGGWADDDCATENLMFEMDNTPLDAQLLLWQALIEIGMPIVSLVHSGGKSIHSVWRIMAEDKESLKRTGRSIMRLLEPFAPDPSSKNVSRLTRVPGITRAVKEKGVVVEGQWTDQHLIYLNPGVEPWQPNCAGEGYLRNFAAEAAPLPEKLRKRYREDRDYGEHVETEESAKERREFNRRLKVLDLKGGVDLPAMMADTGHLIESMDGGGAREDKHYVRCPWCEDHTGGGDEDGPTDAYIYERKTDARFRWGFHCSHSSCVDSPSKKVLDLLELMKASEPGSFHGAVQPYRDLTEEFDALDAADVPQKASAPDFKVTADVLEGRPTDVDNLQIFLHLLKDKVRYNHTEKIWMLFKDHRWIRAKRSELITMAACVYQFREKHAADKAQRDMAKQAGAHKAILAVLALAMAEPTLAVETSDFDLDPEILCCPNGVLDLRTLHLRPGRPEDMLSRCTAVPYDPSMPTPLWDQHMGMVHPDCPDTTKCILRFLGYSMTGYTREEKMLLLHGNGRNGKGTIVNTFHHIMGEEHSCTLTTSFSMANAYAEDASKANSGLMKLRGLRFALASETEQGRYMNEPMVKAITSGDPISGRFLRENETEFVPIVKICLSTNHPPQIKGTDDGIWSRIISIPCKEQFLESTGTLDKDFKLKVLKEGPGILASLARQAQAYLLEGFRIPERVLRSGKDYRDSQDVVGRFLDEEVTKNSESWVNRTRLYRHYHSWARDNGHHPMNAGNFYERVSAKGFKHHKNNGERVILGIEINEAPTFN